MDDKPLVRFDVEDGIGVVTIDNPPVNALGPGVRDGIVEALEKGEADPNVKAMVMIGAGRSFIAGADIRQFGKPRPTPKRSPLRRAGRQHQAGRGGDPRLRAGRRPGACAGLPLSHRRAERQGRPARGADRHPAGRRRHAAAAAPDRPEGGDGDDRLRPPRAGRRGQGSSASSTRSSRARTCAPRRSPTPSASPTSGRCRACATRPTGWRRRRPSPACSMPCASRSRARPATRRRPTTASPASRRR